MWEEGEERSIMNYEVDDTNKPLEESEIGPTSIDVTDERISIGPTSLDVRDQLNLPEEETPSIEPQQEEPQEENRRIEQLPLGPRTSRGKQKRRRITSYLSQILKQAEKQGNQINKLTIVVQSLQRQKQPKSMSAARVDGSQIQSVKQIKTQIGQLQKQVARIQKDIQKIRTVSNARSRTSTKSKSKSKSTVKARSKKGKLVKANKARKGRKSR
jgi:hypothetical protein